MLKSYSKTILTSRLTHKTVKRIEAFIPVPPLLAPQYVSLVTHKHTKSDTYERVVVIFFNMCTETCGSLVQVEPDLHAPPPKMNNI